MWGRANIAKQHMKCITENYTGKFINKEMNGQIN